MCRTVRDPRPIEERFPHECDADFLALTRVIRDLEAAAVWELVTKLDRIDHDYEDAMMEAAPV